MQSVLNGNLRANRRLSGLIGFRRPIEFGLYGPRLSSGAACLSPAYGLARWEHWLWEIAFMEKNLCEMSELTAVSEYVILARPHHSGTTRNFTDQQHSTTPP